MPPAVRRWLVSMYLLTLFMVVVGGMTRLTGSGLSMVQWHPLMGAIPPLSQADWLEVFAKYQASPQYQQVNQWMHLSDFQRIFLWEFSHRLLGRLLGIVAIVPWIYFLWRKRMSAQIARDSFVAILLGAAQGLLGWFMVKSGLVDRPEVSHFRLAAHFLLAVAVAQWILWILLRAYRQQIRPHRVMPKYYKRRAQRWSIVLIGLWIVQSMYGAFMAGTRAGFLFQSFPSMNGSYAPGDFHDGAFLMDIFHHAPLIHWVHRYFAFVFLIAIGISWWKLRSCSIQIQTLANTVLAVALLQVLLGVLTVVLGVPVFIATMHQFIAVVFLSLLVAQLEWTSRAKRRGIQV